MSLDEFQIFFKATIDSAEEFNDNSNEWILIEHRLRSIKDKFQFLSTKTNRQQRKIKSTYRSYRFLRINFIRQLWIFNSQLNHLQSLYQSLESVDENEINQSINRTKLHRFIRIGIFC